MKQIILNKNVIQQIAEMVDSDGALVSGSNKETNLEVKTNEPKDYGQPQTSKDFGNETGQGGDWIYRYRGFAINETAVKENLVNNNTQDNLIQTNETIPSKDSLSKTYNEADLQHSLDTLNKKIQNLDNNDVNTTDINAIVLKTLLQTVNISTLKNSHKKELEKIIYGK